MDKSGQRHVPSVLRLKENPATRYGDGRMEPQASINEFRDKNISSDRDSNSGPFCPFDKTSSFKTVSYLTYITYECVGSCFF
jgi:hypothetical protein